MYDCLFEFFSVANYGDNLPKKIVTIVAAIKQTYAARFYKTKFNNTKFREKMT